MTRQATKQLRNEHEGIQQMLSILSKLSEGIKHGQPLDTDHLEKIVDFLRVFVDGCHHTKEEGFLFPALEEIGLPKGHGPTAVMRGEHAEGRARVKAIDDALAEHKKGISQALARVAGAIDDYVAFLRQHIEKENQVLFAMADERLPDAKQAALFEQFETLEREKIGVGKHEAYHRLIDQLAKVYLQRCCHHCGCEK